MKRLAFQEAVRRLHCIDFDPLVAAGIMAALFLLIYVIGQA